MPWPRCDAESRARAKFRLNCGAGLVGVSAPCGTRLVYGGRFRNRRCAVDRAERLEAQSAPPDTIGQRLQRLLATE